jgi:hypothetical protein
MNSTQAIPPEIMMRYADAPAVTPTEALRNLELYSKFKVCGVMADDSTLDIIKCLQADGRKVIVIPHRMSMVQLPNLEIIRARNLFSGSLGTADVFIAGCRLFNERGDAYSRYARTASMCGRLRSCGFIKDGVTTCMLVASKSQFRAGSCNVSRFLFNADLLLAPRAPGRREGVSKAAIIEPERRVRGVRVKFGDLMETRWPELKNRGSWNAGRTDTQTDNPDLLNNI